MSFFEINGHSLHVIQDQKISVDPQINMKTTPLHADKKEKAPLYIYNAGYSGKRVKFDVLVRDSDMAGDKLLRVYLNELSQSSNPFTVVTDALDVPNGDYVLLDLSMKQEYLDSSIWSFDIIQHFIREKEDTENELNKDTIENTTNASILARCLPLKPGDTGDCVRALQHALKNAGYYLYHEGKQLEINGVYDSNTVFAVSLLQRDYREDFGLTVNGILDCATKECLLFLAG